MECSAKECKCQTRSLNEVYAAMEQMGSFKQGHSYKRYIEYLYGYNRGESRFEEYEINKELSLYERTLSRHVENIINGESGWICCESITRILRRINDVVNLYKCEFYTDATLEVSTAGVAAWAVLNPNCMVKQRWEFYVKEVFPSITITATDVTSRCTDIIYELVREKIFCDIVFDIQNSKNLSPGDQGYDPGCGVSFELYRELIDCGITQDVIRQVTDCGLTWKIDTETAEPCIINGTGGLLTMGEINQLDITDLI